MASFRLWHLRPPTKLWGRYDPKNEISSLQWCGMSRFVLITRSIFDLTTCAIPLCKALTDGFISTMTPKKSDKVMGTLWPKNWKFHHYNGVAMSRFVLITRSIFDLTTCAIPLCKALTDGFISTMTPKTSDQVMGTLWPKTENFIITMVLRCLVCPHNSVNFLLNDMCHTSV